MAPQNMRGRLFTGYRSSNNNFSFNRQGNYGGRATNTNITDARQVLQRKKRNLQTGFITDLSQKLRSRTPNVGRLGQQRGRISKPFVRGQFNVRNTFRVNRFQNNQGTRGQPTFGFKRTVPHPGLTSQTAKNKFIKVHRGGITVTSKQNPLLQRRLRRPPADELEAMSLDDLPPPLEDMGSQRLLGHSIEARLLQGVSKNPRDTSTLVLVSNLKPTVTEEDINELFGAVGQMSSAQLLHPGAALVTYSKKEDAVTALEYYNNVTLDGMAMRCTILSLDKQKPSISSRLGERTSTSLSASFLSPAPQPSYLSPALSSNVQTLGIRSAGRQVQSRFPGKPSGRTKFTVCLN